MMIAFLGVGLLGSNFVKAMLRQGETVRIWNRTAAKAQALAADGAQVCADPASAATGAGVVHLTLKDDATVDEVLELAAPGMTPGTTIIDHTTTSVEGAIRRTADWAARGFTYLHAPVFMGPVNALQGTGYMMVSGDQDLIRTWTPALSRMTGKVLNYGPETGRASGIKLIGNLFLVTFTAGITDTLALAKGLGIPVSDVTALFDEWNPGALLPARLQRITAGNFDHPSWELDMARKDTRLFLEAAEQHDAHLAVIPAIAAEMDRWIAAGFGHKDWTVIASDAI